MKALCVLLQKARPYTSTFRDTTAEGQTLDCHFHCFWHKKQVCPLHSLFHHRGQGSTSKPEVQPVIRVQILSCFPVEESRIQTSSIATAEGNTSPAELNRKHQMGKSSIYFVTIKTDIVWFFQPDLSMRHRKHLIKPLQGAVIFGEFKLCEKI